MFSEHMLYSNTEYHILLTGKAVTDITLGTFLYHRTYFNILRSVV